MARKRDINTTTSLLYTASSIFIAKGYKRTKMEDITRSMGVSAGFIYRYVESKEALFDLTIRFNLQELDVKKITWPIATPKLGETLQFLEEVSKFEGQFPALQSYSKNTEDVAGEFSSIINEIYDVLAKNRLGIKLIERSALDWPELAQLWFCQRRALLFKKLSQYLKLRIKQEKIQSVPNIEASVRFIINTISFFAIQRHYDVLPSGFNEKIARITTIHLITGAFLLQHSCEKMLSK